MAQKIFDALAPGGYFELQDPSFPMKSDDGTLEGTALEESVVFLPLINSDVYRRVDTQPSLHIPKTLLFEQ